MAWSGIQPSTRDVTSVTAAKPMLVLNPAAEGRKIWHGLVVSLAQDMSLR